MSTYRLTFCTMNVNATTRDQRIADANYALAEVAQAIADGGTLDRHTFTTYSNGVAAFVVTYTTDGDAQALDLANRAVSAVSAPVDSIDVARRGRRYESIL